MVILALDTATTTGAAWGIPGAKPGWEVFTAKGDSLGEKKSRFRFWLMARISVLRPSLLTFEAPYIPTARSKVPMNPATLRLLLAFTGTVEEIAFERQIKCREATVQEITSYFTGTTRHGGRENKKRATMAACARLGWDTVSDDAADALALWAYAESILAPEIAARRAAGASIELPLHGTLDAPFQQRIGRARLS